MDAEREKFLRERAEYGYKTRAEIEAAKARAESKLVKCTSCGKKFLTRARAIKFKCPYCGKVYGGRPKARGRSVEEIAAILAERITLCRRESGLKIDELEKLAGISRSQIHYLRIGKFTQRGVGLATLVRLSNVFNVSIGWLIGEED